jgi:hypothetical protein
MPLAMAEISALLDGNIQTFFHVDYASGSTAQKKNR